MISEDGYIVTNNHVVNDSERIEVILQDDTRLEAIAVGADRATDLALIKVEPKKPLPVAPLGDSDKARVGDWVMAIGNPHGLDHSVTVGILSARGRRNLMGQYDDFLQTDASINRGNSGGPLIDMNGHVIGINSMMFQRAENLGFAIPINMAKDLLPQLRADGHVTRGWLGVQIQEVTEPLAEQFGLDRARGALVAEVFDDSPADRAELQHGDVILEFNGNQVESYQDLPRYVASARPGSEVDVVVQRDGEATKLTAELDKKRAEARPTATRPQSPSSFDTWGFEVQSTDSELAESLGLQDAEGVIVSEVETDSPAGREGLSRGDVIVEADQEKVRSVNALQKVLKRLDKEGADKMLLYVRSGSNMRYITLARE